MIEIEDMRRWIEEDAGSMLRKAGLGFLGEEGTEGWYGTTRSVWYGNDSVRLLFRFSTGYDAYLIVDMTPLDEGELRYVPTPPEYLQPPHPAKFVFYLALPLYRLLEKRAGSELQGMIDGPQSDENAREMLRQHTEWIRKYAMDVLHGDFSQVEDVMITSGYQVG